MKLSLDWLGRYVDTAGYDPADVAYKLTMATAEVEGVETIERKHAEVVVGTILSAEPIDTGDPGKTITRVTVDTGSGTMETVCGAPNVTVGMKSAFAPPGTELATGAVTTQTVYGSASNGMLVSPRELGWGESHVGIMMFPDALEPGTPLADMVPERDHIIEIDNKSITHRPDLWGHYGFARELAAIYRRELQPLPVEDAAQWQSLPAFPLAIDDHDGCPGYCCLDIDGLERGYSPLMLQYHLLAVGLRPINLLVDLTNYIMCELGQPMHAFDGERVRDIRVDRFGTEGTFTTLDSIDRAMLPDDLMIWDHTGPIALAGIMGGEESEIKEHTQRVLLESANFHPARIRRTSVRLGLRTDASMRFEKGQPPYHMGVSIRRFVRLLKDAGHTPDIRSRLTCAGDDGTTPRKLRMRTDYISRTIGMDIPGDAVTGILTSLGFGCRQEDGELALTIPLHRSAQDIGIPNDIVEEVARIYGYDNIEPSMPETEMRSYTFNREMQAQRKIRRFLSESRNFAEVHTYSWYDDSWIKRIGYDPGETFVLRNPAAGNCTRIRKNLTPNLLALIEPNANHRDRFSLYEVGAVSYPDGEKRRQDLHLGMIAYRDGKLGPLQDLYLDMKGAVDEVFVLLDLPEPDYVEADEQPYPWCTQGTFLNVVSDESVVGTIGYVTDAAFDWWERGTQVVWCEINLDRLGGRTYPEIDYAETPVYPGSWMDFSLLAENSLPYSEIEKKLTTFDHSILRSMKFLYRFESSSLPEGMVSYTFRFWLGLDDRTLTNDDLTDFRERFLAHATSAGLTLR